MGVAAYYRGNRNIVRQLQEERRPHEFQLMDEINALPKISSDIVAHMPFKRGRIHKSHGVWWLEDADKPTGTHWAPFYPSLRDLVRSWNISLIGYSYDKAEYYAANT